MTTLHMDSCAAYASTADVVTAGYTSGGSAITAAGGRFGIGSIRHTQTTGLIRVITVGTAGSVGWVARFNSTVPTLNTGMLRLLEGATLHIDVRTNSSQQLTITRNGTLLATGSTALAAGTDYAIALRFKIHDTAGELELWVNGVQETLTFVTGTATTQDTRNGGTSGSISEVHWGGAGGTAYTVDVSELYIRDTAGSVNNTLVADWRVYPRRVTANGTTNNFAPSASTNASNVDDAQGNDGDSTYNSSSTPGDIDLFQFGQVPWTSGTIAAIQHRIVARKDDAGARTIRPKQRQSSTNYSGTTRTLTTAYAHYTEIIETNPATSAAYTTSEMRSTSPEFGYEEVA